MNDLWLDRIDAFTSESPLSLEEPNQAFQDLATALYHWGLIKPPVLGPPHSTSDEAEDEGVTVIAPIILGEMTGGN